MTQDPDTAGPPAGPLSGIKVLDFSRILSGPYASMILADLGAEVIKVEPVGKGDETRAFPPFQGPLSHYYIALNRNKQSLALDLKSPEGVQIARRLAARSDIVLENFRPGVMDRLGLGYEALKADNPRLIYGSITGFGTDSPLQDKPAFDIVAQALSGVMSINREPGQPPNRMGLPMGDMAGSIFALFGLLAALHERHATGRGKLVEIAMLDSLIAMQGYLAQIWFITGKTPEPVGTKHPSIVPYGAFPTSDGHVIVACLTDGFWRNFAHCLGREDLIGDPRFAAYEARLRNRDALEALIEARMRGESSEYWLRRLSDFDVPSAPILSIGEALTQPHVLNRDLLGHATHPVAGDITYVRTPIRFDGQAGPGASPPSELGEESARVLGRQLAMSEAEIAALLGKGVVGQP